MKRGSIPGVRQFFDPTETFREIENGGSHVPLAVVEFGNRIYRPTMGRIASMFSDTRVYAPLTDFHFRLWLFATDWARPSYFRCPPSKRHSDGDVGFRAV